MTDIEDAHFWRATLALAMGSFTCYALLYGTQPILPQLAHEFDLSPSVASLSVAAGTGAMAIFLIPLGIMADRFGRERLMRIGIVGTAVLSVLSALAPNYLSLLILRACLGVCTACVPAAAVAYLGDEIPANVRGKAVGLYIAGNAFGGMFGRVVSALITDWLDWRFSLAALGVLGIGMGLLFVRLLPAARSFTPSTLKWPSLWSDLRRIYTDPALPWLFLIAFLLMGSFVSLYNYLGFRLGQAPYFLDPSVIGSIFLLYAIGGVASAKAGQLADTLGHQRVAMLMGTCMATGALITLFSPLPVIIFGIALFTIGYFGVFSVSNAWVGYRAGQRKALVSALFFSSCYLGSSVLGTVTGIAWAEAAWIGVVMMLLAGTGTIILTVFCLRKVR